MSCRISHSKINGLKAIHLENNQLKIGVLLDRGSDIFEFIYKPKGIDFLLRLPKGIQNPQRHFSQIRNTKSQFEDYYYGGWQVCLPNSPAFNYRGAELGQHGEVALIPWDVILLEESEEQVTLKVGVTPLRVPIFIERTFTLLKDSSTLQVHERITNVSKTHLDIMWGQHIAFGLPFLEEGVTIETNAKWMETEPAMPKNHAFQRNQKYKWPAAKSKNGEPVDASKVSPKGADSYADLCYLSELGAAAYYSIKNDHRNVGFGLQWDGELFKDLWYWQERNATVDFPWWGNCYTVALEPWTSKWTQQPEEAIKNGEWLRLEAGESKEATFKATAFEDEFKRISL
ncbi:MAG: galactose mutarotase-like enzyme [Marinoscillum sp.]|jgi:galactose mutarotase-like enzyme